MSFKISEKQIAASIHNGNENNIIKVPKINKISFSRRSLSPYTLSSKDQQNLQNGTSQITQDIKKGKQREINSNLKNNIDFSNPKLIAQAQKNNKRQSVMPNLSDLSPKKNSMQTKFSARSSVAHFGRSLNTNQNNSLLIQQGITGRRSISPYELNNIDLSQSKQIPQNMIGRKASVISYNNIKRQSIMEKNISVNQNTNDASQGSFDLSIIQKMKNDIDSIKSDFKNVASYNMSAKNLFQKCQNLIEKSSFYQNETESFYKLYDNYVAVQDFQLVEFLQKYNLINEQDKTNLTYKKISQTFFDLIKTLITFLIEESFKNGEEKNQQQISKKINLNILESIEENEFENQGKYKQNEEKDESENESDSSNDVEYQSPQKQKMEIKSSDEMKQEISQLQQQITQMNKSEESTNDISFQAVDFMENQQQYLLNLQKRINSLNTYMKEKNSKYKNLSQNYDELKQKFLKERDIIIEFKQFIQSTFQFKIAAIQALFEIMEQIYEKFTEDKGISLRQYTCHLCESDKLDFYIKKLYEANHIDTQLKKKAGGTPINRSSMQLLQYDRILDNSQQYINKKQGFQSQCEEVIRNQKTYSNTIQNSSKKSIIRKDSFNQSPSNSSTSLIRINHEIPNSPKSPSSKFSPKSQGFIYHFGSNKSIGSPKGNLTTNGDRNRSKFFEKLDMENLQKLEQNEVREEEEYVDDEEEEPIQIENRKIQQEKQSDSDCEGSDFCILPKLNSNSHPNQSGNKCKSIYDHLPSDIKNIIITSQNGQNDQTNNQNNNFCIIKK